MQSSFVDIGLERDAFLYVSEVVNTVEEFERLESGDDEDDRAIGRAVEPSSPDGEAAGRRGAADAGRRRRGAGRRPSAPSAGATRSRRRLAARRSRDDRPPGQDRRPAEGRPGGPRPGRQGAARHQGRAPDLARDHAGALPGLHADGRSRRRVAQDRVARGARAACAASSASSASSTASPAASSSAPPPAAARRKTSSAT